MVKINKLTMLLLVICLAVVIVNMNFFKDLLGVTTSVSSANDQTDGLPIISIKLPAALTPRAELGKTKFDENCAACHGENAVGQQNVAPPLIHIIYEPNHHSDESFQLAVQRGVRAHHWKFGNMPAIEGVSRRDVEQITVYIRELQRTNGIF